MKTQFEACKWGRCLIFGTLFNQAKFTQRLWRELKNSVKTRHINCSIFETSCARIPKFTKLMTAKRETSRQLCDNTNCFIRQVLELAMLIQKLGHQDNRLSARNTVLQKRVFARVDKKGNLADLKQPTNQPAKQPYKFQKIIGTCCY